MFDGKVVTTKKYGKASAPIVYSNVDILERARKQREERARDKIRAQSAIRMQALVRGRAARRNHFQKLRGTFDTSASNVQKMKQLFLNQPGKPVFVVPCRVIVDMLRSLLSFFTLTIDRNRLGLFAQFYIDSVEATQEGDNLWLVALGPHGGAASQSSLENPSRLQHLLRRYFIFCIEAVYDCLLKNEDETLCRNYAEVLRSLLRSSRAGDFGRDLSLRIILARNVAKDICLCLKLLYQANRLSKKNGREIAETEEASLVRPLIDVLCFSLAEHPGVQTLRSCEETECWEAMVLHVLTIPGLKREKAFRPLLEFLAGQGSAGWDRSIAKALALTRVQNSENLWTTTDKIHLVFNIHSCCEQARSKVRWLWLLNHALADMPLVELLHAHEFGASYVSEAGESGYHLGHHMDGMSRLEYQIAKYKEAVLQSRLASDTATLVTSFSAVLDLMSESSLLQAELANGAESSANENFGLGSAELIDGLGLFLLSSYGRILVSCPSAQRREVRKSGSSMQTKILTMLAFSVPSKPLPRQIWLYLISKYGLESMHRKLFDAAEPEESLALALVVLFGALSHQLSLTDDEEFKSGKVLMVEETKSVIEILKAILYRLYKSASNTVATGFGGSALVKKPVDGETLSCSSSSGLLQLNLYLIAIRLFNQLYNLNSRYSMFPEEFWQWNHVSQFDLETAATLTAPSGPLANPGMWNVLSSCPQLVPFVRRVTIFQSFLEMDKASQEGSVFQGWPGFGTRIVVRRDQLFRDSFSTLHAQDVSKLKGKLQIEFVSAEGTPEAGIDGGGLFKEFMDSFVKETFDPRFGLFNLTSTNLLVPNPSSESLYSEDHLEYFQFAGKMLGKAMYDCILVESQFSVVFLNVLLGKLNEFDDLLFLDEQMYKSLKQLKDMAGRGDNVEDLDLYFVVQRTDAGEMVSTELIPGGSQVRVTKSNIHEYLHKFAYHKLNVEISAQCRAFLSGFRKLIRVEWMRLFSPRELQLMICGEDRGIDIEDWKKNINYAGGYHEAHPYIQGFWQTVRSMSVEEQRNLLKFVTSCSRQPLRGFSQLHPLICIQRVPQYSEDQFESSTGVQASRLPSAATCMNLLKLPEYDSIAILKEKLLYAITNNNMGFELS